jgi:hypothetical protein
MSRVPKKDAGNDVWTRIRNPRLFEGGLFYHSDKKARFQHTNSKVLFQSARFVIFLA